MKKVLVGMSTMLLFFGTQAYAAQFLTEDGVANEDYLAFTYSGDNYSFTVINRSDDNLDSWNDSYFGFTGADYTGYYLGTFSGNDSEDDLKALAWYYLESDYDYSWYKVNAPNTSSGPLVVGLGDRYTGSWSIDEELYVSFYSIKASNEFALYYVGSNLSSGDWTTRHTRNNGGNIPNLSHLSVLAQPIPEPSTTLLFGLGALGFAGIARRRKNNK